MSRELPIPRQDDRSDGTAVVEWGAAEPGPAPRPGRSLSGLARDRRVPPVLAGLGAVAATASLTGEWLVMTLPNGGPTGSSIRVPAGLTEIGNLGTGYLVGLLVLVTTVALALWGTRVVRVNARVAGLALAGALLALLATTAVTLDDAGQRTRLYAPDQGFEIDHGRGLVMAFIACALLGAALWPITEVAPADDGDDAPAGQVFRRRERGPGPEERDDAPPAPADLTVQPTMSFARPESPS